MRARTALAALTAAFVAGCSYQTGGRPANDPRYIAAVRDYYNAHASEPEAGCTRPQLVLFRDLQVVDSFGGLELLRMFARFNYEERDPASGAVLCSGQGERYFRIFKSSTGPKVQGMSGSKRDLG